MAYESATVKTARDYYNSEAADQFYAQIWGGEDIHIGCYETEDESIFAASHRTVEKMASLLNIGKDSKVIDIGSGYGGSARYLAKTVGCHVTFLNLSEVQNNRNRHLSQEQGLAPLIEVIDGSFEQIPVKDGSYDLVWSQDAILHSGNRPRVVQEVSRILKSGGELIFTDIMQREDCPAGVLQPVLDRIHLETLGSLAFYRQVTADCDMTEVQFLDLSQQLVNHYSHVLADMNQRYDSVVASCGTEYIDRMKVGLQHWIDAGKQGYLQWGILHFRKS